MNSDWQKKVIQIRVNELKLIFSSGDLISHFISVHLAGFDLGKALTVCDNRSFDVVFSKYGTSPRNSPCCHPFACSSRHSGSRTFGKID